MATRSVTKNRVNLSSRKKSQILKERILNRMFDLLLEEESGIFKTAADRLDDKAKAKAEEEAKAKAEKDAKVKSSSTTKKDTPADKAQDAKDTQKDVEVLRGLLTQMKASVSPTALAKAIKMGKDRTSQQNHMIADIFSGMIGMIKTDPEAVTKFMNSLRKFSAKTSTKPRAEKDKGAAETKAPESKESKSTGKSMTPEHIESVKKIANKFGDPKKFGDALRDAGVISESHIRDMIRNRFRKLSRS